MVKQSKKSSAKRQRLYRQRHNADPQRRENYLQKQKERYQKDKQVGKRKLTTQMSARDQRAERSKWRKRQQACRRKKKELASFTPPPTPDYNAHAQLPLPPANTRRTVSKNAYQKLHRKHKKQDAKIEVLKRKYLKYKKKLKSSSQVKKNPSDMPQSKANTISSSENLWNMNMLWVIRRIELHVL
jgi:hypothetical protein